MRAFIALDLPQDAVVALARLSEGLDVGRAVAEENLHLTLAFLEEVPDDVALVVNDALAGLRAAPFDLHLSGLDLFGGRRPSVLFVAARPSEALTRLHDKVHQAVRAAGLNLPRTRFRPHVTIARFKPNMDKRGQARLGGFLAEMGSFALPPFPVTDFSLYRSTLRPDGAVHEALAQYPLNG